MQTTKKGTSLLSLFLTIIVSIGLAPTATAKETVAPKPISIAQEHLKNKKDLQ